MLTRTELDIIQLTASVIISRVGAFGLDWDTETKTLRPTTSWLKRVHSAAVSVSIPIQLWCGTQSVLAMVASDESILDLGVRHQANDRARGIFYDLPMVFRGAATIWRSYLTK